MPVFHGVTSSSTIRPLLVDDTGAIIVSTPYSLHVQDESGTPDYGDVNKIQFRSKEGTTITSPATGTVKIDTCGFPIVWQVLDNYVLVANSTETVLLTVSLTGNKLARSDRLQFYLSGNYLNNSGSTRVTTFKLYIDSTVIATVSASNAAASTYRAWKLESIFGWYNGDSQVVGDCLLQLHGVVDSNSSYQTATRSSSHSVYVTVQLAATASNYQIELHGGYLKLLQAYP